MNHLLFLKLLQMATSIIAFIFAVLVFFFIDDDTINMLGVAFIVLFIIGSVMVLSIQDFIEEIKNQ